MPSHREIRTVLEQAFAAVFGRAGSRPELQCVQAVAWLESRYGSAWKPPGHNSLNLGAIQAGSNWTGATFQYTDTSPNADGTSTPYVTKFRAYSSLMDAAIDLVQVVYVILNRESVREAASRGDTYAVSAAMYRTGYYEGFGPTDAARIANHHKQLLAACVRQARALDEPMPDGSEPPRETLSLGDTGPDVMELQRLLFNVPVDGLFGPTTHAAVEQYQRDHGLLADGVVGPITWAALLEATTEPSAIERAHDHLDAMEVEADKLRRALRDFAQRPGR